MKKSTIIVVFVTVCFLAMLFGCAQPAPAPAPSPAPAPAPAPAPKQYVLKWAQFEPGTSTQSRMWKLLCDLSEEYSNGQIKWEYYPGGQLAKGPDLYEATRDGIADGAFIVAPYEAGTMKIPTILDLPFAWPSMVVALGVFRQWFDNGLTEYYRSYGVHPINCWWLTQKYETWTTEEWGPVTKLADLEGCKVRAPGGGITKAFDALGAVPVTIPSPEAYTAVQRGTLDAAVMAGEIMVTYKLPEVVKYALRTGFGQTGGPAAINVELWDSLPQNLQYALQLAAEEANLWGLMAAEVANGKPVDDALTAAGVEINYLTPEEEERWKAALEPLWGKWLAENGDEFNGVGSTLYNILLKETGRQ